MGNEELIITKKTNKYCNRLNESRIAFRELQKHRKLREDIIDDKAELHRAWEEKYLCLNGKLTKSKKS